MRRAYYVRNIGDTSLPQTPMSVSEDMGLVLKCMKDAVSEGQNPEIVTFYGEIYTTGFCQLAVHNVNLGKSSPKTPKGNDFSL